MKTTIKELEDDLNNGYSIIIECFTMQNGGSHRYWVEDGVMKCYGSGQNWCDQSDDCVEQDVHEVARTLYHERANILSIDMNVEDYF